MVRMVKLTGTGCAGGNARAIAGDFASGLTATGSTQTDALLLSAEVNEVTTTASSTGVRLPANCDLSDSILICNYGAQTLSVYPPTGESISNGSANAAFSVATNKSAVFTKISTTRWGSNLSA